jgi:outer membrane receptor protein involved in Fe transport
MRLLFRLALTSSLALPLPALAEEATERSEDIIVYGRAIEQISIAKSGSEGVVGYQDFENRPLSRVGELAENVPGVIATQHSGSGKANQFFLRGFNLDHGTDFAGSFDGVPINMRSHGHGQGYLDLNFIIPETIERIDYRKGPYSVESGDFSAAGSMAFTTKSTLAAPIVDVTIGSFGYLRALAAGSFKAGSGDLLFALDGTTTNGPFVLDEDLKKINGLIKWTSGSLSIGASGYASKWTSTDQVPERAIASGLIPRNGFIDDDLGGRTQRYGGWLNWKPGKTAISLYATRYQFRLTSNFTYFLDDPVNGDEFRQEDRRWILGGSARHTVAVSDAVTVKLGGEARWDLIGKVGLFRSRDDQIIDTVRQDKLDEYSGALFADAEIKLAPKLRASFGVRGDVIGYDVRAALPANAGKGSDGFLAPKASLAWQALPALELYANYGESFHSNDVRGATINVDPVSGDPVDRVPVFARARGAELGARLETRAFSASLVGFYLGLESELVFVGDAGTTEPNGATRRYGAEATIFWRPTKRLTIDTTAAITRARFRQSAGFGHIPGAVPFVVAGGASFAVTDDLSLTARVRHFGSAPLIEDNSVRSEATTLVNLGSYWTRKRLRFGVDVLNLFNSRDPDISYFYASRLPGEPADGVEDRHIHPVERRQVRASVRLSF